MFSVPFSIIVATQVLGGFSVGHRFPGPKIPELLEWEVGKPRMFPVPEILIQIQLIHVLWEW